MPANPNQRWTPELAQAAKILWRDGIKGVRVSVRQIAAILGNGLTGSAVAGFAGRNREEFPIRDDYRKDQQRKLISAKPKHRRDGCAANIARNVAKKLDGPIRSRPVEAQEAPPTGLKEFNEQIPMEQRKSFQELSEGQCKWPVGYPEEESFFFCGGEALKGCPYCEKHMGYSRIRNYVARGNSNYYV